MSESRPRCGAKTKGGGRCKLSPMSGASRCKLHGGATPKGAASPHYVHGRYSLHLPERLRERFAAAAADPELLSISADVALVDVLLGDLLERLTTPPLTLTADDVEAVTDLAERRSRLAAAEAKRRRDEGLHVPVEEVQLLLTAVTEAITRVVTDPAQRDAIRAELARLSAGRPRRSLGTAADAE